MEPSGTRARFLGNLLSVMQGPRAPAGVTVLPRLAGGPPGSQHGISHVCAPRTAGLGWAGEGTRGAGGGDAGAHVLWHRHPRMARSRGPTSGRCFPRRARCLQRSPVSDDSGPRLRAFEKAVGPPSPLLVTRVVTVAHHVGTHERAESVSRQPHKHVSPWGLTRDTAHTAPEPRVRFNSLNEEH